MDKGRSSKEFLERLVALGISKEEISELWGFPVELLDTFEFGKPEIICLVVEEDNLLEPTYDITFVVPILCTGYPPGNPSLMSCTKHAITLRIGLFSGMWKVPESAFVPRKVVKKEEGLTFAEKKERYLKSMSESLDNLREELDKTYDTLGERINKRFSFDL